MSIAQELLNSETFLREAYSKLEEKGAIMPEKKNLANLASTIENMPNVNFVDYIESTGTQWIDTGVITSSNIGVELDFQLTENTTNDQICGGGTNGAANTMLIFRVEGSNFRWYAGGDVAGKAVDLNRHVMKMNVEKQKLYLDGVSYGSPASTIGNAGKRIYLFTANYYNTADSKPSKTTKMKVYSFKIYNNGVIVRDFKPCKDPSGVYCLYETITKIYYYNVGTGEFRGAGWQPSYIETTGTQYIDTGINLTSSHNLVFDGYAGTGGGAICGVIATNGDYRLHHLGDNKYRYVRRKSESVSDGYVFSSTTYAFDVRHVLRTDANNLYVDETLAGTVTSYELNCDIPLYVFGVNKYNTAVPGGTIRMYSFKIYDSATLVRDYVPALDSENVPCLYDKVSQTYFYNQGTGEFLYG